MAGTSKSDKASKSFDAAVMAVEIADAIRENDYAALERIPELRNLLVLLKSDHADRARLAESLNLLPLQDLRNLFEDYVEEEFDGYLHKFFDRLLSSVMTMLRSTISARMEVMEDMIQDLRRSVLMAAVHPYGWVNQEIADGVVEFLAMQPGQKGTSYAIYRYLAEELKIPLPGVSLQEKMLFVHRIAKSLVRVREWDGLLFELVEHAVVEGQDAYATSDSYRDPAILKGVRRLSKERANVKARQRDRETLS